MTGDETTANPDHRRAQLVRAALLALAVECDSERDALAMTHLATRASDFTLARLARMIRE